MRSMECYWNLEQHSVCVEGGRKCQSYQQKLSIGSEKCIHQDLIYEKSLDLFCRPVLGGDPDVNFCIIEALRDGITFHILGHSLILLLVPCLGSHWSRACPGIS